MANTDTQGPARERLNFHLVQDEDGYPPADVETLWVFARAQADYEIDNVPFFVKEISVGDHVGAEQRDGALWFTRVNRASGHSTLRIIVEDAALMQQVRNDLASLGCATELSHIPVLAAVDVPPTVDLDAVLDWLSPLTQRGALEIEVASLRHRSKRW